MDIDKIVKDIDTTKHDMLDNEKNIDELHIKNRELKKMINRLQSEKRKARLQEGKLEATKATIERKIKLRENEMANRFNPSSREVG